MATKNSKRASHKAGVDVETFMSADDPLPGSLEREFRLLLGRHNLHLNLLELAAVSFAKPLPQDLAAEKLYIRERAKEHGFHALYPNSTFANARNYLAYSHIAYVFSAGDALCTRLRATVKMTALANANEQLFKAINKGDSVTRMVAQITLGLMPQKELSRAAVDDQVKRVKELDYFKVVNRYKLARNRELHGANSWEDGDAENPEPTALLQTSKTKKQANAKAVPEERLTTKDALECSKAWQKVAKWLCRHMLSDEEGQMLLQARFGNLRGERREIAARAFMKEALLYSPLEVSDTIRSLRW